jgi:type I restriction enzyme M protein
MKKEDTRKKQFKQYFTPPRIAEFMVDFSSIVYKNSPDNELTIIDPSCGEGVFLKAALTRLQDKVTECTGFDKDESLSLLWKNEGLVNKKGVSLKVVDSLLFDDGKRFSVALGNPPFGMLPVNPEQDTIYKSFELYQFSKRKETDTIPRSFPAEVLFLERFVHFLKPGGKCAIVLPQGIFTNEKMSFIRTWLLQNTTISGIIFLPKKVFTSTGAAAYTTLLFFHKNNPDAVPENHNVLWATVNDIDFEKKEADDLDRVLEIIKSGKQEINEDFSVFFTPQDSLKLHRWDPEFHHPRYNDLMEKISSGGFKVVPLSSLITSTGIVTGYKGVQETSVTENRIPFITSRHIMPTGIDFTENRIFIDKNSKPDSARSRLRPGDILLVRSGEACIGRTYVVNDEWKDANIRSEIYILRPEKGKINPYYLSVYLQCFQTEFRSGSKWRRHKAHFQICRMGNGVGTPNLNKMEILSIQIPLIPEDKQKEIEKQYKKMQTLHNDMLQYYKKLVNNGLSGKEIKDEPVYREKVNAVRKFRDKLIKDTENYITGE